jgi:hypothetical protein
MAEDFQTRMRLAEQYLQLMDEIEYRRVDTAEDLEDVGMLRAKAYRAHKVMDRKGPIIDEIDHHSHAHVFAIYYREQMISTIRLHHVVSEHRYGTSVDIFPDILNPLLDQGMSFIDPVRHASDPELMGELPLPFLTLRLGAMATEYFNTNYCLAPVKRAHYAFYRRYFGATQLAEERMHEGILYPVGLFAGRLVTSNTRLMDRYPYFRSTPRERELLFAPAEQLGVTPLTVRPTARLALAEARRSAAA